MYPLPSASCFNRSVILGLAAHLAPLGAAGIFATIGGASGTKLLKAISSPVGDHDKLLGLWLS